MIGGDILPELGGQRFLGVGVDVAEDGIAVFLVADDDATLQVFLSLICVAGLAWPTGWVVALFPSPFISAEQFHQTAIVLVQPFQDQMRSQTETQDEILQSQRASNLVLRVDEPQQQTVSFALQQFGQLLLALLRLLYRFY